MWSKRRNVLFKDVESGSSATCRKQVLEGNRPLVHGTEQSNSRCSMLPQALRWDCCFVHFVSTLYLRCNWDFFFPLRGWHVKHFSGAITTRCPRVVAKICHTQEAINDLISRLFTLHYTGCRFRNQILIATKIMARKILVLLYLMAFKDLFQLPLKSSEVNNSKYEGFIAT